MWYFIGKLLKDLESKHSCVLMQDAGSLAKKKALGAATKDVSSIARSISKAATTDLSDLMKKRTASEAETEGKEAPGP